MLSLVLAPLAIFIITDQLEILVCLFVCFLVLKETGILLPSLLCISQWKQARRKTETETKPICHRQFCRGRPDQTEAANFDLLRHRCLVIPSVSQLRPLRRGSRGRTGLGTTSGIFWKQFKQPQWSQVSSSSWVLGSHRLNWPEEQNVKSTAHPGRDTDNKMEVLHSYWRA